MSKKDEISNDIIELKAYIKLIKGIVLVNGKRNFSESLENLEEAYSIFTKLSNNYGLIISLKAFGSFYILKPDNNLALQYFNKANEIVNTFGNQIENCRIIDRIGSVYYSLGNVKKAEEYFQKSLIISKNLNLLNEIAKSFFSISLIKINQKKFNEGVDFLQQSLKIRTELNQKNYMIKVMDRLQRFYFRHGDLQTALNILHQQIITIIEIKDYHALFFAYYLYGEIYTQKGELDRAINKYEEGISALNITKNNYWLNTLNAYKFRALFLKGGEKEKAIEESIKLYSWAEQEKYNRAIIIGGQIIGNMYLASNQIDLAMIYFNKTFKGIEKGRAFVEFEDFAFDILTSLVHYNYVDLAKKYLILCQENMKNSDYEHLKFKFQLIEAIILKASPRLKDKFKAQEILENLVKELDQEYFYFSITIFHLCEILSLEMQVSENPEALLNEIEALNKKFMVKATQNLIYPQIIQGHLLNAQVSLIQGKISQSQNLLDKAYTIAKQKGLNTLKAKVKTEQEKFRDQIDHWDQISQRSASIKEKLKDIDLHDYYKEAMIIQKQFKT